MKIVEEYNDNKIEHIEVKLAKYMGDFLIKIFFNDGIEKLVNFKPFLQNSLHPSISKYLDENLFKCYKIIDGNLNWNDYDLIFPIESLYNGRI